MTSSDEIERARLEGAREALTEYAKERESHGSVAVVHNVSEFLARRYPAPRPPLPTEPGSLLRLDATGADYCVRPFRGGQWWITGEAALLPDDVLIALFPNAVQVFAKTQDEWDTLIAEAEKRGRGKALDEAQRVIGACWDIDGAVRVVAGLRDGEAS